jgi:hypothetical protein
MCNVFGMAADVRSSAATEYELAQQAMTSYVACRLIHIFRLNSSKFTVQPFETEKG